MRRMISLILTSVLMLLGKDLFAGCESVLVKSVTSGQRGSEYLAFDRNQEECNTSNTVTWSIGYEDELKFVSDEIAAGRIVVKFFQTGGAQKVGKEIVQGLNAIFVRPKAGPDFGSIREQARFMNLASKALSEYQAKVVSLIANGEANAEKINVQIEFQTQEWDQNIEDSRSRATSALVNSKVAKEDLKDAVDYITKTYPTTKEALGVDQKTYEELKKGMLTPSDVAGIKGRVEADIKNFPNGKSLESIGGLWAIASREQNELRKRQYLNALGEYVDDDGIVKAWRMAIEATTLQSDGSSAKGLQLRQVLNEAAGLSYYGQTNLQVDSAHYAIDTALAADRYLSINDPYNQRQGSRLADRSRVLLDYQTGSSRLSLYSGVKTSSAATSAFGLSANGSSYEGFQIASIANKLADTTEILNSPELYFYAASSLKQANFYATAPGEGIRFHKAIDTAYAVYDFVKGFGKGLYQFVPDTYDGIKQLVTHPIDSAMGLYTALCNAKETNEAIFRTIDTFVAEVPNYSNEQYGELSGRVTAEIGAALLGAGLVKKADDLIQFNAAIAKIAGEARLTLRLPSASTFEGTIFRAVPEEYKASMWNVADYDAVPSHRYSATGVKGIYGSLDEKTLMTELESYGIRPGDRYVGTIDTKLRVLDLTDPQTLNRFGVTAEQLTQKSNYVTTHIIGEYASKAGYDGLVFQAATSDGKNIVLFKTIPKGP